MSRRDLHLVLAIFLVGLLFGVGIHALIHRAPTRDCGRLTLEEVEAAGVRPGDCAVMPKNRNGG